jgi:DNA-binding NarL/FixJ family response regulator
MTIRVLIADDQAMIRGGLRLILEDQPDISVVGEAADGAEAIRLARRLRPDVSLVDIRMPGKDGIDVTRAIAGPGVADPLRVVVVTTFDLDEYVYGALRSGAVGFVLKGASPALLVEAVRAAHAGDALISPQVTLRLLQRLAPAGPPAARVSLSDREAEVVRAVARGRTNNEIAGELFISLSTVKSHLASIQDKLGVRNRVEIAAWAWEELSRRGRLRRRGCEGRWGRRRSEPSRRTRLGRRCGCRSRCRPARRRTPCGRSPGSPAACCA